MALLICAITLAALVPPARAVDTTYLASWDTGLGAIQFTEHSDPYARFEQLHIQDTNGDGYPDVPTLPANPGARVVMDPTQVTDLMIQKEIQRLGWSNNDIVSQFNTVLGGLPQYSGQLATATADVRGGHYAAAVLALGGTPADIVLWCGSLENPSSLQWVIGVPAQHMCGGLAPVVGIAPQVISAGVSGAAIDSIHLLIGVQGEAPLGSVNQVGMMYRQISGGVVTDVGLRSFSADVTIFNIVAGTPNGRVTVTSNLNAFGFNDKVAFSPGLLGYDSTLRMSIGGATSWFVDYSYNGFTQTVSITPQTAQESVDGYLYFGASRLDLVIKKFPNSATIHWDDQGTASGTVYNVQTQADTAVFNTEIQVTFRNDQHVPVLNAGLVGLPQTAHLRINLPDESQQVFSAGLSKDSSNVAGRFRSIAVDGQLQGNNVNGMITDVNRVDVVTGGTDPFDSDGDTFVQMAADFVVTSGPNPSYNLHAKQSFFRQFTASLAHGSPNDPWTLSTTTCLGCMNAVPHGSFFEEDALFFNAYFWSITDSQLQLGTWCIQLENNVCP